MRIFKIVDFKNADDYALLISGNNF